MPIYEYQCVKCGHKTEVLQKFSDAPITECTACHGGMKKLISQSTFHLKGTGWYVTDYASKTGGNQGTAKKAESKAAGGEKKAVEASSSKKASSDS